MLSADIASNEERLSSYRTTDDGPTGSCRNAHCGRSSTDLYRSENCGAWALARGFEASQTLLGCHPDDGRMRPAAGARLGTLAARPSRRRIWRARGYEPLGRGVWIVSAVVTVGVVASILDTTIVSVALETLVARARRVARPGPGVSTAYLAALAVAIPLIGWMPERFGARHRAGGGGQGPAAARRPPRWRRQRPAVSRGRRAVPVTEMSRGGERPVIRPRPRRRRPASTSDAVHAGEQERLRPEEVLDGAQHRERWLRRSFTARPPPAHRTLTLGHPAIARTGPCRPATWRSRWAPEGQRSAATGVQGEQAGQDDVIEAAARAVT